MHYAPLRHELECYQRAHSPLRKPLTDRFNGLSGTRTNYMPGYLCMCTRDGAWQDDSEKTTSLRVIWTPNNHFSDEETVAVHGDASLAKGESGSLFCDIPSAVLPSAVSRARLMMY